MGKERSTQTTIQNQTTTPAPTAEETELNKLDLEARRANQQGTIDIQRSGLNLGNLLLKGMGLPGYLSTLPMGIGEDVTQNIVSESLRDIKSFGQQGGILDSGVLASIAGRTAGDIRMNSAQFNLQNLQQLLNLAVGGQAQIQQPIIGQSATLGQRLAGLRSINQQGTSNQQFQSNQNPFLNAFAGGVGTGIGSAFGKKFA